jgi:hypothetical protein
MSLEAIGTKKLAILLIAGGVAAVFLISGFQARDVLFAPSVTEDVRVEIKEGSKCIVEPSDRVPRTISNCEYNVGDTVSVTYKRDRPGIERHELR